MECKRDIARRLYDIGSTLPQERITRGYCQESYLDGLWLGLMLGGMRMREWEALEEEIYDLLDGLIECD